MGLKLALTVSLAVLVGCSDDTPSLPVPGNVIDLYDPCTVVTTSEVNEAVGFEMVRSTPGAEDADEFRSCRWIATGSAVDLPSIDYLDVNPRPFVDIVIRQTGVDGLGGVDAVFAEVKAATNTRIEPALLASDDAPRLADDARRTDTTAWAIQGNRMLIISTSDPVFLDALIESVSAALLERL